MTSHSLAIVALAALSVSACAHVPPEDPSRPGHGMGPPEGRGQPAGPPRPRQQLFISPAGEPFRALHPAPYPVAAWFAAADLNHDAALSREEFVADAERFFTRLDVDKDDIVDGFEVSAYETKIAPEILLGSAFQAGDRPRGGPGLGRGARGGGPMGGGLQGATPYALLAEPQPVMGADADFNRRISRAEAVKAARSRFVLLDTDADQLLRVEGLPRTPVQGGKPAPSAAEARRRPGSPR